MKCGGRRAVSSFSLFVFSVSDQGKGSSFTFWVFACGGVPCMPDLRVAWRVSMVRSAPLGRLEFRHVEALPLTLKMLV